MSVDCAWDTSMHDCATLNKPTPSGTIIFGVVRVAVRLAYPPKTEIVLRKRIAINIYRKPSIRDRLFRHIVGETETRAGSGVYYDVVAHVPKASLEREEPASLARMAAQHPDAAAAVRRGDDSADDESRLESYIKSIQAVEWMLKLDRLRQESAVFNMLSRHEKSQLAAQTFRMKRTISLPNTSSVSADE